MIMMIALHQFEDGLITFEVMSQHDPSRFELGQYTVYGGKTNIIPGFQQRFVYIFGGQMPATATFKNLQNLEPWQCHLQSGLSEVSRFQRSPLRVHVVQRVRYYHPSEWDVPE
jgi:hypothetical protein